MTAYAVSSLARENRNAKYGQAL